VTALFVEPAPEQLVALDVQRSDGSVRVVATGEIDSSSAPEFRRIVDALLDDDESGVSEIVIDLAGVTFLDSAGLCVLAAAHRRTKGGSVQLRILASSRAVIRPLQITGLWELLRVEQSNVAALPSRV
jgi:anti-sigma B factor antagonist